MNLTRRWLRMLLLAAACVGATACFRVDQQNEGTLRHVFDREAIDATMHRYLTGLDHLDRDLYAGSFADDGVLDIDGNVRMGRDAMRKVIDGEIDYRKGQKDRGETPRVLFHMETNVNVSFTDPDHVERTAYWVTYIRVGKDPEGLSALGVGTSVDLLARIDNQWLITKRTISLQP
jgi:hypothetical protein